MPEKDQANNQGGNAADDALKGGESQDGNADLQDAGKHVSKESWDKLLDEKKKEQDEKRKLQAKLDKYEADHKKAADEKLKADGKLQELIESKEKDLAAKTERIRRAELKVVAKGAGLQDMDYVDILMKSATFNDQDELENGEELFKELQEKKPYLFATGDQQAKVGTNNAGAKWKPGHVYTKQELENMTPAELEKNWPEIQQQDSQGLIK